MLGTSLFVLAEPASLRLVIGVVIGLGAGLLTFGEH